MRRRTALTGIAAGALTAASWRRVLGANDRPGVALVGAGARGLGVMKALLDTGRAEVASICDVWDERRREARQKLLPPGAAVLETPALEEAVAGRGVDAVLIATPDHLHCDQTLAALAAGKHVYLEKPVTHRPEEGPRLLAAVARSGKVCQTGTQQRSGAHYLRARHEIFERRRLGDVVLVRAAWADLPRQRRRFDPEPKPAGLDWPRFLGRAPRVAWHPMRYHTWRYVPAYGNGLVADLFAHWADVAQWMMDDAEPLSAVATGGIYALRDGRENPDTVSVVVQYRTFSLAFDSTVLPVRMRAGVVFHGTDGTLEITRDGYTFTPRQGAPEVVKAEGSLDAAHATDFLEALRTGRRPSADIERGVAACRPVHLANAAYWKGRRGRRGA